MAWWTWGHWGDFQIDSGRELYVPAEILKGKLLFRDLWYMYGPLAPYVKAFLFWIFGVKLNVLFSFGLAMAFTCALLTFEVARRFGLGPVASAVPALYFVLESFDPNIRNFVYPYAYAASLACVLGMACLYFASRHATEGRTWQFALASVLGSLVVLTKQEFGIACLALLGFDLAARYWARRDASEFFRNVAICVAALLPAAAVYGWFIWTLSPREFFYVNWIATPGSFFMHTFGKISIPAQGMRFVPRELLLASELLLLVFAEWALISRVVASSIQKWDLTSRWVIAGLAMAAFLPAWIGAIGYRWYYPWTFDEVPWAFHAVFSPMSEAVLPHGVFFPVPFFAAYALWKLVKAPRNEMALLEAMLGIYAFLVGLRMMMSLRSTPYEATVFFNGPTITIFFLLIYRVIRWACQSVGGCKPVDCRDGLLLYSFLAEAELLSSNQVDHSQRELLHPHRRRHDISADHFLHEVAHQKRKGHSGGAGTAQPVHVRRDGCPQPVVCAGSRLRRARGRAPVHRGHGFERRALRAPFQSRRVRIQGPRPGLGRLQPHHQRLDYEKFREDRSAWTDRRRPLPAIHHVDLREERPDRKQLSVAGMGVSEPSPEPLRPARAFGGPRVPQGPAEERHR